VNLYRVVSERVVFGHFAWERGDIIELLPEEYEWIEKRLPGSLQPYKPRRWMRQDRMVREAQHER